MTRKKTGSSSLSKQVEEMKKKKLCEAKVVSLTDFRELRKPAESKTILVVDDDEIMRAALKRLLEAASYKVILASDGMELSKVLEATKLDLILLDVNLPWVDGLELCRLIKGHGSLKHVPLLFVSGNKSEKDIQEGFAAGGDEYITKPFEVDTLLASIEKYFRGGDCRPA